MSRAVVLLSGGLDSATTLAIAAHQGFECHCLTVSYGQRHAIEQEAARRVAQAQGAASHRFLEVDLRSIGGSALTEDLDVPKGGSEGIPVTYVPARNTVLLSLALALAEVLEAHDLFIGVTAVDYSGYPDCRPEFIQAFERMAGLATKAAVEGRPVKVHAPLVSLSKAEIIRQGLALGVDYSLTHSCYDPGVGGEPCGACDACRHREHGFRQVGLSDPALLGTRKGRPRELGGP